MVKNATLSAAIVPEGITALAAVLATTTTAPPVQAFEPADQQSVAPMPVQALEPVVQPLEPAVPDWLYAGPAAPILDDVAAPLPSPTPAVVEVGAGVPLWVLPSVPRLQNASRVHVHEGNELAFVSATSGVTSFTLGSGVHSLTSAAVADSIAPPRLASPTPAVEDVAVPPGYPPMPLARGVPAPDSPATPPPSPRTGARRRLVVLGLPLPSSPAASPSSSRGRRAGLWSPAALGPMNGVAPGTLGPGGSSDEDERDGSSTRRR